MAGNDDTNIVRAGIYYAKERRDFFQRLMGQPIRQVALSAGECQELFLMWERVIADAERALNGQ